MLSIRPGIVGSRSHPGGHISLDGLVTQVDPENAQTVLLVKLDPQNLTERDLLAKSRRSGMNAGGPRSYSG